MFYQRSAWLTAKLHMGYITLSEGDGSQGQHGISHNQHGIYHRAMTEFITGSAWEVSWGHCGCITGSAWHIPQASIEYNTGQQGLRHRATLAFPCLTG